VCLGLGANQARNFPFLSTLVSWNVWHVLQTKATLEPGASLSASAFELIRTGYWPGPPAAALKTARKANDRQRIAKHRSFTVIVFISPKRVPITMTHWADCGYASIRKDCAFFRYGCWLFRAYCHPRGHHRVYRVDSVGTYSCDGLRHRERCLRINYCLPMRAWISPPMSIMVGVGEGNLNDGKSSRREQLRRLGAPRCESSILYQQLPDCSRALFIVPVFSPASSRCSSVPNPYDALPLRRCWTSTH